MNLSIFTALLCVAVCSAAPTSVSKFVENEIAVAATATIEKTLDALDAGLRTSLTKFTTANRTCHARQNSYVAKCRVCVKRACQDGVGTACSDKRAWTNVLRRTSKMWTKGLMEVFDNYWPVVNVNNIVTGGVIDIRKNSVSAVGLPPPKAGGGLLGGLDLAKIMQLMGGMMGGFGKKKGNGTAAAGGGMMGGLGGLTGLLGGLLGGGGAGGAGGANPLAGLFGKRAVAKAPTCDDYHNDPTEACTYFAGASECKYDCSFYPMSECNGFEEAVNAVAAANAARGWLSGMKDKTLKISKLSFDPDNAIRGAADGLDFADVEIDAVVFGKSVSFMVDTNPYTPVTAGPAVARKAMAAYQATLAGK